MVGATSNEGFLVVFVSLILFCFSTVLNWLSARVLCTLHYFIITYIRLQLHSFKNLLFFRQQNYLVMFLLLVLCQWLLKHTMKVTLNALISFMCKKNSKDFLVHGQVTIVFVVSVGFLSVCLFVQSFSQPSLIRFR